MLKSLHIENIILMDRENLEFHRNFNVITGESGAGKSIIIDSINIILGERVNFDILREGKDAGSIVAVFDISRFTEIQNILNERGYTCNDEMIIKKTISRINGTRIFLNDSPSTVQFIKQITNTIIEIHSQMEQHDILNSSKHIYFLDRYGDYDDLLKNLRKIYEIYSDQKSNILRMEEDLRVKKIKLEDLECMRDDIKRHDIKNEEENQLLEMRNKHLDREKINNFIKSIEEFNPRNAIAKFSSLLIKNLSNQALGKYLEEINQKIFDLELIDGKMNEIHESLIDLLEDKAYANNTLESIENRIDLIRGIGRKYKVPSTQIFQFLESINNEIETTLALEDNIKRAKIDFNRTIEEYNILEGKIYSYRIQNADEIANYVTIILRKLGMQMAEFMIKVEKVDSISNAGSVKVEFMAKLNSNSSALPINKIASGGELSRISLALKSVISRKLDAGTIIFDEIETGLDSKTCQSIACEIEKISKSTQVIAITHNPFIAQKADLHIKVIKNILPNETYTSILTLNKNEIAKEIEFMMLGK